MSKYRVLFEARDQVDGFTNPAQDLEYRTVNETVTVKAKNKKGAVIAAVKQSYGWTTRCWPRYVKWYAGDIKRITRIIKK